VSNKINSNAILLHRRSMTDRVYASHLPSPRCYHIMKALLNILICLVLQ